MATSRRPGNPSRRVANDGSVPLSASLHPKSKSPPLLTVGFVVLGAFLLIGYSYNGLFVGDREALKDEGLSCTAEVQRTMALLKKAYGGSMQKVLHVGPDTCSVVSHFLEEDDTEAWGIEPYEMEDPDSSCKNLVRKGIVRVADIKFPLPYKTKSFSHVIVSDALDYLSPRYLNKTLPDLASVAVDGLIVFAGYPGQQSAKVSELPKFGRPAKLRSSSWWVQYFPQTRLEENELATNKFKQAAKKKSYKPSCQIFHLRSHN